MSIVKRNVYPWTRRTYTFRHRESCATIETDMMLFIEPRRFLTKGETIDDLLPREIKDLCGKSLRPITLFTKPRKNIKLDTLLEHAPNITSWIPCMILHSALPTRVLIGSYETSQKLYIDILGAKFKSFKKTSVYKECEYYKADDLLVVYDNNLNMWKDSYYRSDLGVLKSGITYLELRELYMKIKQCVSQYLNIDIIQYIIDQYIPDKSILSNIVIR